MRVHRLRTIAIGAAASVLAAGCGARLNQAQIRAAEGGAGNGQVADGTAADGTAADGTAADGNPTGADNSTGAVAGAGAVGSSGAAGSRAGAVAGVGAAATTLPAGGNGGATDIGVTATSITVGAVATTSGPVPGLFRGAHIGTQAFMAYQNSLGGVFGRKFKVDAKDDAFDSARNRQATQDIMKSEFASVGGFSLFDDAGADVLKGSPVPDVQYALSQARGKLANNFSPQPLPPGWRLGPLNYFKAHYPDAIKSVGALIADVSSAKDPWNGEKAAMAKVGGYSIQVESTFQATQTDFTSEVVRMRNNTPPVQMLVMSADAASMGRVAKAAAAQNWHPLLPNYGANAYDASIVSRAGSAEAVEGMLVDMQLSLYIGEDSADIPEVKLFNTWLNKVSPGYKPDIFAAFSWAASRMFVQAVQAAGPKVTRDAVMAELKKIDNFDSNGMLAPAGPASKRPPNCYVLVKMHAGKWSRFDTPPGKFRCDDGDYFHTA